ncbi:MAG: class I SAM-dependent methyltransferase [Planctomycetes bacterium]|nr:class I SAM-dependent methyltransferase [Planctomycetota bacterium]MCB9870957.1 class I SAM-dependent methyltransferase [Planctomycetota bacterium]MCB9888321.1 class I SAM-dependent methyltransferase [Planctomycetota bacterium]
MTERQTEVAAWFDRTYQTAGFKYLRPIEAYPIFLQLLDGKPGERLLDVACGLGLLLKAATLRDIQPTGIDISAAAIEIAQRFVPQADLRVGNVEQLPFADGAFDMLTCIGALERFLDRERALQEMHRVLTPTGRMCVMVRNAQGVGWKVWRKWLGQQNHTGHQDAKTLEQWRALLESQGFDVQGVYMDQWGRQKLRRLLRGFRPRDLTQPEPVARPLLSLRLAYEFILILRKRERPTA